MSEKTIETTDNVTTGNNGAPPPPGDGDNNWNKVSQTGQKVPVDKKKNNNPDKPDDFDFFEELSIRFVAQQDQTTKHRTTLMKWFAWITGSQLFVINALIVIAVFWKPDMIDIIFNFLKFFIGATFLELLGGLIIIVNFAFSHETYDMLKHLTYVEPKSK